MNISTGSEWGDLACIVGIMLEATVLGGYLERNGNKIMKCIIDKLDSFGRGQG